MVLNSHDCVWKHQFDILVFLRRRNAGLQLFKRELLGNHHGAELLQVSLGFKFGSRVGEQPRVSAGLHGAGNHISIDL